MQAASDLNGHCTVAGPPRRLGGRSILVGLVCLILAACGDYAVEILEAKDITDLAVTRVSGDPTELVVSGLPLHSAMVVRSVETEVEGRRLVLIFRLGLVAPGESGAFEHRFVVPDTVMQVCIGRTRSVVWERPTFH